jgi:hypothetical protein
MARLTDRLTALRTAGPIEDRWWLAVPLPYAALGLQTVALVVVPDSAYPSWDVYVLVARLSATLFFGSLGVALLGLYFDVKYVRSVSEWQPTFWYSSMFFVPVVGAGIGAYYLYRRWRAVGLG